MNKLYPDEVEGSSGDRKTTRFAFHEEGSGGHFGIDDGKGKRGGKSSVYVVEQCGEIGGIFIPAIALFLLLGRGGELKVLEDNRQGGTGLPTGTGMRIELGDRTMVIYRWSTSTAGSSALEIKGSGDSRVADHKVHFYEEESRYRKQSR